jgi:hypothetical protein
MSKEIKFLAVARRTDKVVLASRIHSADKAYDYLANVNKVLCSPGWASVTTDKLSLDDGGNMFYILIDEVGSCASSRSRRAPRVRQLGRFGRRSV